MAITRYAGDRLTGLSTDVKPTNVGDGAIFEELDTFKTFTKVSGTWLDDLVPTAESLRSNVVLTGGGTVTVDASFNLKWSSRFIISADGRGSYFSTSGYFDISLPTNGTTITGVGGASNTTVTSNGIALGVGQALYYILPIGASNTSVPANFRLCGTTVDVEVPASWVLIAVRDTDGPTGHVRLGNGITLVPSSSFVDGQLSGFKGNFISLEVDPTGAISSPSTHAHIVGPETPIYLTGTFQSTDGTGASAKVGISLLDSAATRLGYIRHNAGALSVVNEFSGGNINLATTSGVVAITGNMTISGAVTSGTWQATKIGLLYGGTNADLSATGGAGQYLKQSSVGAAITVGTIPASDIVSGAALTKTDDTNVTLTLGGSPTTALLAATSLTLGWNGTLAVGRGGIGVGTLALNGVLYGNGVSAVQALAVNSTGTNKFLTQSSGAAPAWATIVAGDISALNVTWTGTHTFDLGVNVNNTGTAVLGTDAGRNLELRGNNASPYIDLSYTVTGSDYDWRLIGTDASTLDLVQTSGSVAQFKTTRTIFIGSGVADGSVTYQLALESTALYNASPVAGLIFTNQYNSSNSYAGMGGITVGKENATDGNYSSYLAFHTRLNGNNIAEALRINSAANVGIGTGSTISARLHSLSTTEQLRLGYDSSNYSSFTVSLSGNLTIHSSGGGLVVDTITSGTWNATPITTTYGGTGLASFSQGDLLYYNSGTTLTVLNKSTGANRYLKNSGTSNNPQWATITPSDITTPADLSVGTSLQITAGTGTGAVLQAVTINAIQDIRTVASPTFVGLTLSGAVTGTTSYNGLVITANTGVITTGTWNGSTIDVSHGGTGATSFTSGGILFGNGTGAIQVSAANATATNKFLTQVSTGTPSWATIVAGDISGLAVTWTQDQIFQGKVLVGDATPETAYNGRIVVERPAASGQYINLIRASNWVWSIGYIYNTNTFAIGSGQGADSSFTTPVFAIDSSSGAITTGIWNATTIAIAHGGTGAVTAVAGFNALSPATTRGDLITNNGTNNVSLSIGSSGKFLKSNGTDPSWQLITPADVSSPDNMTVGSSLQFISSTTGVGSVLQAVSVDTIQDIRTTASPTFANETLTGAIQVRGGSSFVSGAGIELEYNAGTGYVTSYDRGGSAWEPLIVRGSGVTVQANNGVVTIDGSEISPSASGITSASSSVTWVELPIMMQGVDWTGTSKRFEIWVSGGVYEEFGTAIFHIDARGGLRVKKMTMGGDPNWYQLKIYHDDSLPDETSPNTYRVGFLLGSSTNFFAITIKARETTSGEWMKITTGTEPSTGYTNATPAFTDMTLGNVGSVTSAGTLSLNASGNLTLGTVTTGTWHAAKIGLAYGGTNADLSATGGAGQYLKQSSSGAAITVGTIPASDIVSGAALTKVDDTNVTLTLGGSPATALLAATSISVVWNGTLAVGRGGIGVGTLASNGVLYGNGASAVQALAVNSGSKQFLTQASGAAPAWASIAASDISTLNVTWTGNHVFMGLLNLQENASNTSPDAADLIFFPGNALNSSNIKYFFSLRNNTAVAGEANSLLVFSHDGTNFQNYFELKYNSNSPLITAHALTASGAVYTDASKNLVAGTLAVAYGGTGLASYSQGDLLYYNSGTTLTVLNKNTGANRYLKNSGTSNNPKWDTITPSDITTPADLTLGTSLKFTGGTTGVGAVLQTTTIDAIQDIRTTASPTFVGLTLSGAVIGATSYNGLVITANTGALTSGSIGGSFGDINIGTHTVTAGRLLISGAGAMNEVSNLTGYDPLSAQLRVRRNAAETTGGNVLFLELFQDDVSGPLVPLTNISLRFHHAFRFWDRIEAQSDGFHLKTGDLTADTYVNLTCSLITVRGSGEAIRCVGSGASGSASQAYITFYDSDGSTRRGYVGDGGMGDQDIWLEAETGNLQLGASGTVIVGSNTMPGTDNSKTCGGASNRWSTVYAVNAAFTTVTSGTWNGATITVPYGGTGATSFSAGALLFGNGTSAISVDSSNLVWDNSGKTLTIGSSSNPSTARLASILSGNAAEYAIGVANLDVGASAVSGIRFDLSDTASATVNAATIEAGKEPTWTSSAGTHNAYLSFSTTLAGTGAERWRITSSGKLKGAGTAVISADTSLQLQAELSGLYLSIPNSGTNITIAAHLVPNVDGGWNLGSTSARYTSVFASNFKAQGATSPTVTFNPSSGATLTGIIQQTADNIIVRDGTGAANRVQIALGSGNLIPSTDNASTLGGSSNRWSTIYGVSETLSSSLTTGAEITVNCATEQLKLAYDGTYWTSFITSPAGFNIANSVSGYVGINASTPGVSLDARAIGCNVSTVVTTDFYPYAVTIISGGTAYTVGDVLTVTGGVPDPVAATILVDTVSGGVITGVTLAYARSYTTKPANHVSVTGGTGTGATFDLSWLPLYKTARICSQAGAAGDVVTALHIDESSNGSGTFRDGTAISFGLQNQVYGEYTSRIIHWSDISNSLHSRLQLQTHAGGVYGLWNSGILIDESGNVGIGISNVASTTSPVKAQLMVWGLGQTTASLDTAGAMGGTLVLTDSGSAPGNGGALVLAIQNSGLAKMFAAIKGMGVDGSNNGSGDLVFSLRTSSLDSTLTEKWRITGSGQLQSTVGGILINNIGVAALGTDHGRSLELHGNGEEVYMDLATTLAADYHWRFLVSTPGTSFDIINDTFGSSVLSMNSVGAVAIKPVSGLTTGAAFRLYNISDSNWGLSMTDGAGAGGDEYHVRVHGASAANTIKRQFQVIDATNSNAVRFAVNFDTGTITTGIWNATTIDVAHGGTGAGTFTSGGVLFGNGTSAIGVDASNLYWDNSSKRLAIGNGAVAGAKIHVTGTGSAVSTVALRLEYAGVNPLLQFSDGVSNVTYIGMDHSTGSILFGSNVDFTNNDSQVIILPSGYMGINTTNPQSMLDVNGVVTGKNFISTLGTVTADVSAWDSTVTWNNASVLFVHNRVSITNTHSHPASELCDWQVGGTSMFAVSWDGNVSFEGSLTNNGTVNGQTINSVANFTGSLTVAGATTINNTLYVRKSGTTDPLLLVAGNSSTDNVTIMVGTNGSSAGVAKLFATGVTNGFMPGTVPGDTGIVYNGNFNFGNGSSQFAKLDSSGNFTLYAGDVTLASAAKLKWSSRSVISSPADGEFLLQNSALNDFYILQLGGTLSTYPALKRNGADVDFRLANDSDYTTIVARGLTTVDNTLDGNLNGGISMFTYSSLYNYFRPSLQMYRGRGSSGVPAKVTQWDWLGTIQFHGYEETIGQAGFVQGCFIQATAIEDFTSTASGTKLEFYLSPTGGLIGNRAPTVSFLDRYVQVTTKSQDSGYSMLFADETDARGLGIAPSAAAGIYNGIVGAKDTALIYGNFSGVPSIDQTLVIAPWSTLSNGCGLKMDSTGTATFLGFGQVGGYTVGNFDTTSNIGGIRIQDSQGGFGNGGSVVFGAIQGFFAAIKGYITDGTNSSGHYTLGKLIISTRRALTDSTLTQSMIFPEAGGVELWDGTARRGAYFISTGDFTAANLSPPGAPTLVGSGSGGSMNDGTYYYVVTAVGAGSGETTKGTQSASVTVSGGSGHNSVGLSWTGIQGAKSYKIYRTTTSGTYSDPSYITEVTAVVPYLGTQTYTDTAATPSTGIPPTYNDAHANHLAVGASWLNGSKVGINRITTVNAWLDVAGQTEQLRLNYDPASTYASFTVDSSGNLLVAPTAAWAVSTNGTTRWNVTTAGDLTPQANVAYNIGSTSARVLSVFARHVDIDGKLQIKRNDYTSVSLTSNGASTPTHYLNDWDIDATYAVSNISLSSTSPSDLSGDLVANIFYLTGFKSNWADSTTLNGKILILTNTMSTNTIYIQPDTGTGAADSTHSAPGNKIKTIASSGTAVPHIGPGGIAMFIYFNGGSANASYWLLLTWNAP